MCNLQIIVFGLTVVSIRMLFFFSIRQSGQFHIKCIWRKREMLVNIIVAEYTQQSWNGVYFVCKRKGKEKTPASHLLHLMLMKHFYPDGSRVLQDEQGVNTLMTMKWRFFTFKTVSRWLLRCWTGHVVSQLIVQTLFSLTFKISSFCWSGPQLHLHRNWKCYSSVVKRWGPKYRAADKRQEDLSWNLIRKPKTRLK